MVRLHLELPVNRLDVAARRASLESRRSRDSQTKVGVCKNAGACFLPGYPEDQPVTSTTFLSDGGFPARVEPIRPSLLVRGTKS